MYTIRVPYSTRTYTPRSGGASVIYVRGSCGDAGLGELVRLWTPDSDGLALLENPWRRVQQTCSLRHW